MRCHYENDSNPFMQLISYDHGGSQVTKTIRGNMYQACVPVTRMTCIRSSDRVHLGNSLVQEVPVVFGVRKVSGLQATQTTYISNTR